MHGRDDISKFFSLVSEEYFNTRRELKLCIPKCTCKVIFTIYHKAVPHKDWGLLNS